MSITAREWDEAMEYLYTLEDLLEAIIEADRPMPDGVQFALAQAKAMKHVWYNRDE